MTKRTAPGDLILKMIVFLYFVMYYILIIKTGR